MPSLLKHHPFILKSATKGWCLQHQQNNILLSNELSVNTGWFKLSIRAVNSPAILWLQQQPKFNIHLNDNHQSISLIKEKQHLVSLVFLQHQSLNAIRLSYSVELTTESEQFEIVVKKINPLMAWFSMLNAVSRHQRAAGQSGSYIYRITRARQKRAGWQHALKKLIDAYHPALSQQLISSEPYRYWQLKHEPKLVLPEVPKDVCANICFNIFINGATDADKTLLTIHSLQQQSYHNWRLNLDADIVLSTKLTKCIESDQRISFRQRQSFQPDLSCYFVFLRSGDLLAAHALMSFTAKIIEHNKNSIFYSDHDFINTKGNRVCPHFKPQWSPDYMLNKDYIGRAYVVPAILLQSLFTKEVWWHLSEQQLLLLALIEQRKSYSKFSVIHLAYVLFHFTEYANEKLSSVSEETIKISLLKLANTEQNKVSNITRLKDQDIYKLNYEIPLQAPLVTLLIPTRDCLDITRNCVESILRKTEYSHYEIVILDNQSAELATLAWFDEIQQHEKVTVLRYDFPFNYSAINNFGVQHAKGELIGLVNNDVEVINGSWLTEMVQHAIRHEIGCVGAKLYFFDDTIQHGGVIMGLWGLAGHSHKHYLRSHPGYMDRLITVQNYSAVTAACLLIRKHIFEQVNGLDEENLVVAFNDVDLCLKVQQAGYRNLWTPYAELYHYESKSRGKEDTPAKKAREKREIDFMRQKWPEQTTLDPYYSPHLTHCSENFNINIE